MITTGGVFMLFRTNQRHLIGAAGYLMSAFLTVLNLILLSSYYVNTAAAILVSVFSLVSTGLVLGYFFSTAAASKDMLIKAGGFLAGCGYGVLFLMTLLQLLGAIVPILSLLGAIAAITGVVLAVVRFMMRFQRDSLIVMLCIVSLIGLFLSFIGLFMGSLIAGIGDIIIGIGFGSLLLYFRSHNISY